MELADDVEDGAAAVVVLPLFLTHTLVHGLRVYPESQPIG